MGDKVELSVRSQLDQILQDFDNMKTKVEEVNQTLKKSNENVTENVRNTTKKTKNYFGQLSKMGKDVSRSLKDDFKALLSLEAIGSSLKITEQFKGSIKQAINLSDQIRKMGDSFGIADNKRSQFHKNMIDGLGELGLASEVGARTMEGLVDTPVKGEKAVIEYARAAGQLSSISGQEGQEGAISAGIAKVIQAQGGDVNSAEEISKVAEDLRRVFKTTGKSPTEVLGTMEKLFTNMSKDMRESIGSRGLAKLAAAGQVAGPNSTKFLEEFLGKSAIQRQALEAQGFKGVFTDEGIDIEKFQQASQGVLSRVGGDPRMAAKTLGLSDEAAEGFIRLAENLDKVKKAQEDISNSTGNLTDSYRKSMGLGEAFQANINKVKSVLSTPISKGTEFLTEGLAGASESGLGSAAVVGGGGILAALLAGKGLKGIGGGLLGGMAKKEAYEGVTGEKVTPVYVVNANEIGGSGLGDAAGMMGKKGMGKAALGLLGKAGLVGAAGAAGVGIGSAINKYALPATEGTTSEGFQGNIVEQLFFKLDKLFGGEASTQFMKGQQAMQKQKVIIENRASGFKTRNVSRGSTH